MTSRDEITTALNQLGDGTTPNDLLPLVYPDLRRLAQAYFKNEKTEHTLQATALVHEAYIRLVNWENVSWQNRAHFFAVAAEVMRKILIDHARKKSAQKRDGGQRLIFDDALSFPDNKGLEILRLEEALKSLEALDPRQAKIVELRFFGGLSIKETAHVTNVSETTVKREWSFAKAWLQRELTRE